MRVKDANSVFNHAIVGGSEYGWRCWPHARWLDYESEHAYGSVVFSTADGMLYEATVTSKDDTVKPYRWVNLDWSDAALKESKSRNIDHGVAWDDVRWVDLELWEDFDAKARALWCGQQPDPRILVPIDLPDDVLLHLALEAHKQDITLNELVSRLLRAEIDAHQALNDNVEQDVSASDIEDFRELCTRPHETENDDTSTSDVEHSEYWQDTDRNR